MGWLEDHVRKSKGHKVPWSKMARELQRAPGAKGLPFNEKSLATYLGNFDKGKDLHLFERHPRLSAVLTDYLQLSEEDFQELLSAKGRPQERQHALFPLWDANTRPINLSNETLPAAFPVEVLDPRHWPVLWRAPSGSGRTLVGKWHQAQGKAFFIEAESWSEAQRKLPRTGRVFLELKSPVGLPFVEALPPMLDVCIAVDRVTDYQRPSPFEERSEETKKPEHTWRRVDTPPVAEWLEELVFWLEERRASAEGFDSNACMEWLRKEILPEGFIDGFETAVGFVGVYAEYGKRIHRGPSGHSNSLLELAQYFLRGRLRRIPEQVSPPNFPGLRTSLLRMARLLLVRGEQPWFQARSMEEWQELLHTEPGPEFIDWLSQAATRNKLKVSKQDLKRAAEDLPPAAFQLIRTLQQLYLLREQQPGLYAVRPSWVFEALLQEAADTLLNDTPEEWGEALLHAYGADFVIDRLVARCQHGDFGPLHRLLSARDLQSPAWVAALESCFVVLGWTLLHQSDAPDELVSEIFTLQQMLTVEVHELPLPRTLHGHGLQSPLLNPAHWLLAAHALSERRGSSRGAVHAALDPWAAGTGTKAGNWALQQIWNEMFEKPQPTETRLRVLELYGRMLRRVGSRGQTVGLLQLPEFLLARFQASELTLEHVQGLKSKDVISSLLRPYMERRGQPWAPFARALWQSWLVSNDPLSSILHPSRKADDFWSFIPPEAIQNERLEGLLSSTSVPFELFGEEQWAAFLSVWPRRQAPRGFDIDPALPWRHMPDAFIRKALSDNILGSSFPDDHARQVIWKKAPGVVRTGMRELVKSGKWIPAVMLARAAPAEEAQGAISIFREGISHPEFPRVQTAMWLRYLITMRIPGWREAWKLLGLLESGAAKASG